MSFLNSDFYKQIEAVNDTIPPVDAWNPALSGDMDCVIKRDASWWIDNSKVTNNRLIRLFSTVLKREGSDYFIITPVEKWRIQVEDLPFMVVELNITQVGTSNQTIAARTNVGDLVTLDDNHRIDTSPIGGLNDDQMIPFVHIRSNLMARFNRNTYLEIAELLQKQSEESLYSILSANTTFDLSF
ncbi:MAG: hypothetical protein ACI9SC_001135 [Gammaproteobacteria bacterium]|jgi:hypothetical protein